MAENSGPRLVIVDTDPGIDDAMALAFLRNRPDIRLLAITTVFGNAEVATTTRNAAYLARRFGIDAPVHGGAESPLAIDRRPAPEHVHGRDGLGDSGSANLPPAATTSEDSAAEHIVRLIRENPGRISILALGPLTNLAHALRLDPDIATLTREVVVMGGAFGWAGRRGNVSPVAEANIRNDPHAADIVFGAPWPVTAVGLDVTSQCVLKSADARSLTVSAGEAGQFLWDISRRYEAIYRDHDGLDGFCLHDVTAAVYLLEPHLFETVTGPIRVVTDGIAAGQTIQRPDHSHFPSSPWDNAPSQLTCSAIDAAGVIKCYLAALNRQETEWLPASG